MIKLNPIFADGMIMQAGKPVRIFGSGAGEVTATLGGESVSAKADTDRLGRFVIELSAHAYGELCCITVADSDSEVVLHDVLFGDVYLFSGQSNMAFKLNVAKPDGELYESDEIRFYSTENIQKRDRFTPADGWVNVTKDTAPELSALAYFTARELHKNKRHPIGIISAHQGASVIESWLSITALDELGIHFERSDLFPDHYMDAYSEWNRDGVLYELDIEPIMPYSLAGVVWYQGESNCGGGESVMYDRFLSKLVASWREGFCDEALPFVIVQIADFDGRDFPAWHEIQHRQELVCDTLANCRLAVSRDISETNDIHPPTKHLLGKRIADLL